MNGKQAKRLRRIALGLATLRDSAGHKVDKNGYEEEEHSDDNIPKVTIHTRKDTYRGLYKQVKKGIKKDPERTVR